LKSLKLWEPGRVPPRLAIEVVSTSLPHKDYGSIQERYAAMGVEELVVFDPLLCGPRSLGGPVALQLWRRDATLAFQRMQFGPDPVHSQVLDAWFIADGRDLQISNDRRGTLLWLTAEEQLVSAQSEAERAHAEAERAHAEAEQERQARQDLERRVQELESKFQR
jgi:hypothetical protein